MDPSTPLSNFRLPVFNCNRVLRPSNHVINIQSANHKLPRVILYSANEEKFCIHKFCITLNSSTIQNEAIKKIYIRFYDPNSLTNSPVEYMIPWNGNSGGLMDLTHITIEEKEFPVGFQKVMAAKPEKPCIRQTHSFEEKLKDCSRFICIKFLSSTFEYEHTSRVLPFTTTLKTPSDAVSNEQEHSFQEIDNFLNSESMNSCIDLETSHTYFLTKKAIPPSIEWTSFFAANTKQLPFNPPLEQKARVVNVYDLKKVKHSYNRIIYLTKKRDQTLLTIHKFNIEVQLFTLKPTEITNICVALLNPTHLERRPFKLTTAQWYPKKAREGEGVEDIAVIELHTKQYTFTHEIREVLPANACKSSEMDCIDLALTKLCHLSVKIESALNGKREACVSNVLLFSNKIFYKTKGSENFKTEKNDLIFREFLESKFMTLDPSLQKEPLTNKRQMDHKEKEASKKRRV